MRGLEEGGSACRSRAGGLTGEGDTTWPGLSGLCEMLFEIWPLGHLKFYICRLSGRVGRAGGLGDGQMGGRVGGLPDETGRRAGGRAGERTNRWTDTTWPVVKCIALNSISVGRAGTPAPSSLGSSTETSQTQTSRVQTDKLS